MARGKRTAQRVPSVTPCSVTPVHVVIMGCGRVGSTIATSLEAADHSVAIVDQVATAFRRLGKDFKGKQVVGVGFDRDTLVEAGIEQADVFLAATRGDNTNLVIAQLAQRRFNVPRVVVRVADPARAAWYGEQGLITICPTQHAIDQAEHVVLDA